jgi:hypothetical protein
MLVNSGRMESTAQAPRHVMARQNGEEIVHFSVDDDRPLCGRGSAGIDDPRETTCGACLRTPQWRAAWKAEAKRAKVPQ